PARGEDPARIARQRVERRALFLRLGRIVERVHEDGDVRRGEIPPPLVLFFCALLCAPSIDMELLAFFNRPGTPWLDGVMGALSHRAVLLVIAAGAALYLWFKSPHRALAAILFAASIGVAALVSAPFIKPA